VNQRANENVIDFVGEKDVVRLEAEAAIAGNKFVGVGSDARKIGKKPECTLQARMVGVSLVAAERGLRPSINID